MIDVEMIKGAPKSSTLPAFLAWQVKEKLNGIFSFSYTGL